MTFALITLRFLEYVANLTLHTNRVKYNDAESVYHYISVKKISENITLARSASSLGCLLSLI